jgi:hypothetical protein
MAAEQQQQQQQQWCNSSSNSSSQQVQVGLNEKLPQHEAEAAALKQQHARGWVAAAAATSYVTGIVEDAAAA